MKTFLTIFLVSLVAAIVSMTQIQPKEELPNLAVGKCVVQINSDWNKANTYRWFNVPSTKYYFLSLDKFPELKSKMKIKSVPTIIVLQDGKEIKRYEGGLMMKIDVQQQEILR